MAELKKFTRAEAGRFIISLITKKLKAYVRSRKNMLIYIDRLGFISDKVEEFFNDPHNAGARKALKATQYADNYFLLAKRIERDV